MTSHPVAKRDPWVPLTVAVLGVCIATAGWGLDLIGGVPGLGRVQIALIVSGVGLLGLGLLLTTGPAQARIHSMQMPHGDRDTTGVLLLTVWFGAFAGLLDPLILHLQNVLGHRFAYVNQHMTWMSPLSYTILFLAVVFPLLALGRGRLSWLGSRRTAATLLSFITAVSLLLLYQPEVLPVASAFLALAIATQTWRLLRTRSEGFGKIVRRTVAPVFALILVSVGLQLVAPWASERSAKAGGDPSNTMPNVLLIVLDTVRGANVSVNGYARPTMDDVDRRASEGGVVFERAIATSPWSLPSHVSLATGLYPHDFQADWVTPLEETMPTLAEVLSEEGYLTGGFFANRKFGGLQSGLPRGFHHWDVDMMTPIEIFGASHFGRLFLDPRRRLNTGLNNTNQFAQKDGKQVTSEFLSWVEDVDEMPFFAFLNYFDAHAPYRTPLGYENHFADIERPDTPFLGISDPQVTPREIDHYDRAIAFLDDQVESILLRLEELGTLDNTVVIVTSDHGEEFGERPGAATGHGRSLAYAVLHVPLVVLWPGGVPAGTRVSDPVSIRDVPATILDLVGAASVGELEGVSLTRYWDSHGNADRDRARREPVLAEVTNRNWLTADSSPLVSNAVSVFEGDLHYVRVGDSYEQLFNLLDDPWEIDDLSQDPTRALNVEWLRSLTDSVAEIYMRKESLVSGPRGTLMLPEDEAPDVSDEP